MDKKSDMDIRITGKLETHFFGVLNPAALPPEYAEAIGKSDRTTALKVAADYFRNRRTSAYFADLKDRSYSPETAERAVRRNSGKITGS